MSSTSPDGTKAGASPAGMLEAERIYLAALLHDIGKFAQRADPNSYASSKLLDANHKREDYVQLVCPRDRNDKYYSHVHVLWTAQFLADHKTKFAAWWGENTSEGLTDNLLNLATNHHKPQSFTQDIIRLADWYASNMDRSKTDAPQSQTNQYKLVPLRPLFEQLSVYEKKPASTQYMLPLEAQRLGEGAGFPVRGDALPHDAYSKLWEAFVQDFGDLEGPRPDDAISRKAFLTSLTSLLRKYLSAMPASSFTNELQTGSLFDHLKVTAAFALSIHQFLAQEPEAFGKDRNHLQAATAHFPFLLAGIELSGIQKYLYNIANRKAARSLKGRSFFLQMQMTVVANRLLAMCNGQQGQLIYASGGKAYLLLPNTEEVQQAIKALRTQLQQELWDDGLADEHLYAGVDAVAFRIVFHNEKGKYELLLPSGAQATWDLGQLWKALGDQLAIQKRRRFDTLLHTRFGELFSPKGTGGYEAVCAVTGRTGKLVKLEDTTDGEPLMVTSTVKKMYELGRQLAKENSLVLKDATDKVLSPDAYILGNDTTSRRPQGHVVLLNNTDLGNLLRSGNKGMGVTYQWYGGNQVPLKPDDSPKTFEELGADNRLAILRMDVDGLGAIFQSGIPETMRSFTSYATLSSQLDYFFSGYLNHIHQKPAFAQSIQIIYAGGDDVFAVGDWQRLLEFAKAVRDAFRKYVCNREDISISAGFVVVGDKFPISKAAELAGQAEDAAKTHLGANGLPKNAINLLGVNLSWNQEFATVRNLAEWLQAQLESNKLNRSILFKLQQLRLLSKSENPNQRLSWKWQAAYMLGRMDNKEARQPLESLILEHKWEGVRITDDADRLLERIGLACRLAELGTRQNTEHTA